MKLAVISLGCPKNIVDLEIILGMIKPYVEISEDPENADATLINTCAFIETAKQQAIDHILEIAQYKATHNGHQLWVSGCLPQRYGQSLCEQIPEIDVCLTSNNPKETAEQLLSHIGKAPARQSVRQRLTPNHFAYLEISKGCNNRCHYCAIPLIKGNYKSRPEDDIIEEAKELVKNGARELILVGQDTTYYGRDIDSKTTLSGLCKRLQKINDLEWIRLLYTHPAHWTDELIACVAESDKIVNYIDLPIQHINDRLLKAMGRNTNQKQIKTLVDKLRQNINHLALRTSIIVGYPGETEEEFQELFDFINHIKFERLGVFTYSHEEDTAAFQLQDCVNETVKRERQTRIMEAQEELSLMQNASLVGKTIRVLVDEVQNDLAIGRSEWDAPEIDNTVMFTDPIAPGSFVNARITRADPYDLIAKAI